MKKIIVSILAICIYSASIAQSRTTTVEYQKIKRDAIVSEIPFTEKVITAAIDDTLQKLGYKGKESKGFIVYKGVTIPALGKQSHDLYFSVERKSKKDKDISLVTLMISREFDNFITESTDPDVMGFAKTYLDSMRNVVAVYDLELQITEQEDVVKKNDKKLQDLTDEAEKLEDKIAANKKATKKQQSDSDIQKQVLETLRAKRKS